ncbi:MAG: ABC transporter permease [Lachnospiraceae bacterium]|nr:ABC transporter permease [Lachnospiraceae bacterium]
MKSIITKTILPLIAIGLWLAVCIPIASRPEGFNYFMFWVIAGFPFGINFMCLKLVPKSYGITGAVGVFALNAVIGGLIGGAMLMAAIIKIFVNVIRLLFRNPSRNKY